jgi:type IV pilus assembly protein PilP
MYKKHLIVLVIFISFCPFSLFYGCSDKKASDVKSKLVAKKIKPIKGSEISESKEKPSNLAADKTDKKGTVGEDLSATDSQAVSKNEMERSIEFYDPEGKIDPFAPLFQEEESSAFKFSKSYKKRRHGHLTPLEKVDLSQLKLLGIILAKSGNRALVADTSEKGYVVTVGTYIGMSSGRVVEIIRDRIIVEEEVENILGKISLRKRELKLQKLTGD